MASKSTIDILIITALKDELDALKNCDNQSGNTWQELTDNLDYPYYKTTLSHKNGTELNIVAARPPEMGENDTSILATRLISELNPRCLAMTGVCAGHKKDVFLGDVIVADRVFKFDHGKLIANYKLIDNQQVRFEEIFHDIRTYNLNPQWKFAIEDFPEYWLNTIQTCRPKSYYHQERWLLHKLYDYQQQPNESSRPDRHSDRPTECSNWKEVIRRLREKKFLKTDSLELTKKALKEINKERVEYLDSECYKDRSNPKIHVGPIATTSKVQEDPQLFQGIKKLQRKILGVEMEASAIGKVAEIEEIPMIIVKGVQDYADHDKNDQFREYAAEVSARFLLAFLTTTEAYKKNQRSPSSKTSAINQLLGEKREQTDETPSIHQTPIKIDNSIIVDYNLHDLVRSFSNELQSKTGREGVLAFNIVGEIDKNILHGYIIKKIEKILKNEERELYRLIDIQLRDSKREEDIEFYLSNQNIEQTIADLCDVDKSSEVAILVIWNYCDFYEKQIYNKADSFVRQIKTKFSDSLTKEGKYLIIIFGHDKRERTLNDEIFTPLTVTPFQIDDLCRWFKKKLINKTEESKINEYLERLKESKDRLIDTCGEIREIIAELQGRYNNESA